MDSVASRVRLNYYVRAGQLIRIRKGIYAKDADYDRQELATRIFIPSYISFETVLVDAGFIFQYYASISVATYTTRTISIDNQEYIFRKISEVILVNPTGIDQTGKKAIASPERAFLDTLYKNTDYHFDNLRSLDWEKVFELITIYKNKRMEKVVNKLARNAKES